MRAFFTITLLAVVIAASNAFATAQLPDKIFYEGKKYNLDTNPMELYFHKFPEQRPTGGSISTGLWRGYVATFEVIDKTLMLKDIEIQIHAKNKDGDYAVTWQSEKANLVPKDKILQIDWFSGLLVLPYGKLVKSVNMGYGSTYEKYILLEIDNGKLTGERKLDYKQYEQYKDEQFQTFKKTGKYREYQEGVKQYNQPQELTDSLIRNIDVDYTTKPLDKNESSRKAAKAASKNSAACRVDDSDIADSYSGDCAAGVAHGKGVGKGRDEYSGEFKNGRKHGQGTYTWGSDSQFAGQVFVGELNDDEFVKGVWTFKNEGAIKGGTFRNSMLNGLGYYRDSDGSIAEGTFKDDELHGFGTIKVPKELFLDPKETELMKSVGNYWVVKGQFQNGELISLDVEDKITPVEK